MTRLEMIRLALKGYKPGEIAELQELEKMADDADEDPGDEADKDPGDEADEDSGDEELPADVKNEKEREPDDNPTVDYKAQYEEAMQKLAELQQQNLQRNIAGKEKSDDEVMTALLHKFIK